MQLKEIQYKCEAGHEIRFAVKQDIPEIMDFIRIYWNETHILAHDRSFFEYEFVHGEEVCFVLLMNNITGMIEGTLGYIPCSDDSERDMFTAIWKVLNSGNLFAGMGLIYYLMEQGRCRNLYYSGINKSTRSMYKYRGLYVGYLNQYYRLNRQSAYYIAKVEHADIITLVPQANQYSLEELGTFEEMYAELGHKWINSVPYKDMNYTRKRYFEHPIYDYRVYSIHKESKSMKSFLIMREQRVGSNKVLRIVDFIGEARQLSYIGQEIDKILVKEQFEYIDFYQYGISKEIMGQAGFVLREQNDTNIIPNYFEPFIQKNVEIGISFTNGLEPQIFKADGDQDRPSVYMQMK